MAHIFADDVRGMSASGSSVDGVLFTRNQTTLIECPVAKAGSYTIPNSVTTIGSLAFQSCTSLSKGYFHGNTPNFGSDLFYDGGSATVYYLPGTTGWSTTFGGRPTAPWVLPNPVILTFGSSFGVVTNQFGFRISWARNASVVVEASTTLVNPVWPPVSTNTLTDGWSYFSDAEWTNYPVRFYRIRSE